MRKNKQYKIGIDVGGTKISAVLLDGRKIIDDYLLSTPWNSLDDFLVMLKALVDPLLKRAKQDKVKVSMIGMGVPAVLDKSRRQILASPNLKIINGLALADKIENLLSFPVIMDNDVNCFLRAEVSLRTGLKHHNAYGLTIGTGIGGAWWLGKDIYRGVYGGGGEPGSMLIDFANRISLETAYHKLTQNNPSSLADEAYRGDVLAEKTFTEVGEFLGLAMANIVNLIDPEIIIIGGGFVESADLFLPKTKKIMKENIVSSEAKKKVKISKAKLGLKAGAVGAGMLTMSDNE